MIEASSCRAFVTALIAPILRGLRLAAQER